MPTIAERKEAAARARALAVQIRDKQQQLDELIQRAQSLRSNIERDKVTWREQHAIFTSGLNMNDSAVMEQVMLGDTP